MASKVVLIPENQQEEYILLRCDEIEKRRGLYEGCRVFRISEWMSGKGCGVRQALFRKYDSSPGRDDTCTWEDYVKPVLGQVDLFDLI